MTATAHMPLFDWSRDITANRHRNNPQSIAANQATNKARDRKRILEHLETVKDATCEEVSIATGISYQTASGRMSELKAAGLIVPGEKRKTTSGCSARAWRVEVV
jgi:predicted ArsR family transcriptional regulator